MRFEISHEFDAPLDALELALMSPDLGPLMNEHWPSLEAVETISHDVGSDVFARVWRYQAKAPLKIMESKAITREMLAWHEHSNYRLRDHSAEWEVKPCDPDKRLPEHFSAAGSYQLDPLTDGRTRRTVVGELRIHFRLLGPVLERIALSEIRKGYDAEADALRALCSLP